MKKVLNNNYFNIIKNHILIIIYVVVFLILLIGVYSHSGFTYFPLLSIFITTLFLTYYLLNKYLQSNFKKIVNKININSKFLYKLNFFAFASILFFIIVHCFYMDGVPLIKALLTSDHLEVSKIRNEITTKCPTWINYLASFYIKAIIPFYIFYFFKSKKYLFFIILYIIGSFYAISLLQKSYIVVITLPVLIFLVFDKKWILVGITSMFIVSSVLFLTKVANPQLDNQLSTKDVIVEKKMEDTSLVAQMIGSLSERILIVPGRIVSIWFTEIPKNYPFLKGCGYNFLSPILGCEYVNYPNILYNKQFPEYAKQGVVGTLVTASFMHEYANFGIIGLFLSGVFLAIILFVINVFLNFDFELLVVINFTSILTLGASAITTLLLSHGWAIILILAVLYKNDLIKN